MNDSKKILGDLLNSDTPKSEFSDDVGNYLFAMAQDPNHEGNIALKKHFEQQNKQLKKFRKKLN